MVSEHATSITPEKAKKSAIIFLDHLIEFTKSIDELRPDLDFFRPMMQLDELRMRLTSNGPPLKNEYEVDQYLHEVVERMINIDPKIEQQLTNYWKAQIQITTISNECSKDYHPQKLAEENYEQVTKIDELYKYVKLKFNEMPIKKSIKLFDCVHWFFDAIFFYEQSQNDNYQESRQGVLKCMTDWLNSLS